jgi:hypothetical protein
MMFSRIRRRFTYANVVMTLALVFAMSGGALAAKHYLISSVKQINPKVLKQLQGKPGPAGPESKPGAPGAPGKAGLNGTNGTNGTNGAPGESVAMNAATSTECKEGGVAFTVASKTEHACNGSPWTAGGTLPKGATEAGAWVAPVIKNAFGKPEGVGGISFTIPLSAKPAIAYIKEGQAGLEHASECPGTLESPKAGKGFLCVYARSEALATLHETEAFAVGAQLYFQGAEISGTAVTGFADGTWAVTA